MTSLAPNNVPSRKPPKRSKTGPTVRLPKPSAMNEGMKERNEATAPRIVDEEVIGENPEETTITKPDIFQTLLDEKTIIVRCPPASKKDEQKDKDAHINEALDALNGTRRETLATQEVSRSSNMPLTAIEALERIFGKVPEQKTRGSNYGRLAQDFTFPAKNQSAAGPSGTGNNGASSSKKGSESQEDLEEIEKKERRKSNLNALAKEFTPSFFSGSTSTTEADKSVDTSDSKDDDNRKKKSTRKEKQNHEANGDTENPYQHSKKKRQHTLNPETLPRPDNSSYAYDHPYYVPGPPTPYPPSALPHWEELNSKLTTELVNIVQLEIKKNLEQFTNEIRINTIEQNSDDTGGPSASRNAKEEFERENESAKFEKFQDLFIQEMQNYRQEIDSTHDELLSRYDKLQTQHLELQANLKNSLHESQADVQRTSSIQQRHSELQNMHQNLQAQHQQELGQFEEIQVRLQQSLSEHLKIQEHQQQYHNELTHSQRRISELEADLKDSRTEVTRLTSENVKITEENKTLNLSFGDTNKNVRELQNMHKTLYEENQALQQRNERLSLSESNYMKNVAELDLKIRRADVEIESLKNEVRELENIKNDLESNENSWQSQLQEAKDQVVELRTQKVQLEEKLEIQKNMESIKASSKNLEVENLNKDMKRLASEKSELERVLKESQEQLQEARLSITTLSSKSSELEHARREALEVRNRMRELEKQATDLEGRCLRLNELETQVERYKSRNSELENDLKELRQRIKGFEDKTTILEQKQRELDSKRQQGQRENESQRAEVTALQRRHFELQQEKEQRTRELDDTKKELQRLQDFTSSMRGRDVELVEVREEVAELKIRLQDIEMEKNKLAKENGVLRNNAVVTSNIYASPADTPNQELEERHLTYSAMFEQYPHQQTFGQPPTAHNFIPNLPSHTTSTANARFTQLPQTHMQPSLKLTTLVPLSPTSAQRQPMMNQLTHVSMSHPYQAQINQHQPTFVPQAQLQSPISTPQVTQPTVNLPHPTSMHAYNQTSQQTQSRNQQQEPSQKVGDQIQQQLPAPSQSQPNAKQEKNQEQPQNQSQSNPKQDRGHHSRNNSLNVGGKKQQKNRGSKRRSESRSQIKMEDKMVGRTTEQQ